MAEIGVDIEQIVRDVLAELHRVPSASGGLPASAGGAPNQETLAGKPPVPPSSVDGELAVTGRVVTIAEIAGRLDGVRRVVVEPQALVTPAVRDELLRRNVALAFAAAENKLAAAVARVVLVSHAASFDSANLVAALAREAVQLDPQTVECIIAATDQLAAAVAQPGTLGVLLTRHAAAGLCLANRHPGVRAVQGIDAPALAAAAKAVGANLLLLDPSAVSFFQLKQMISQFCRGGTRPCPDVFRARLN